MVLTFVHSGVMPADLQSDHVAAFNAMGIDVGDKRFVKERITKADLARIRAINLVPAARSEQQEEVAGDTVMADLAKEVDQPKPSQETDSVEQGSLDNQFTSQESGKHSLS